MSQNLMWYKIVNHDVCHNQSCIPKILSFIKKEERKKENFLTEPEHLSITLDQTR